MTTLQDLWDAGLSAREIGRRLGVSYNAVTSRARRLGLARRGSPLRVRDEDAQARTDLAELMAEGCPTVAEAARIMRISQTQADQHWQAIRDGLGEQPV